MTLGNDDVAFSLSQSSLYEFQVLLTYFVITHLVTHLVWPHQPENPLGRLGLGGLVNEEAHPYIILNQHIVVLVKHWVVCFGQELLSEIIFDLYIWQDGST